MLHLNGQTVLAAGDRIIIQCGDRDVVAEIVCAGEGSGVPCDDEFYWMHAPAKDVPYSESPPPLYTRFLLAVLGRPDLPCSKLPQRVIVQKEGSEQRFEFELTSASGSSRDGGGCLIYLEWQE